MFNTTDTRSRIIAEKYHLDYITKPFDPIKMISKLQQNMHFSNIKNEVTLQNNLIITLNNNTNIAEQFPESFQVEAVKSTEELIYKISKKSYGMVILDSDRYKNQLLAIINDIKRDSLNKEILIISVDTPSIEASFVNSLNDDFVFVYEYNISYSDIINKITKIGD